MVNDGPTPSEAVALATADGLSLQGQLVEPAGLDGTPVAAAVICHPHPLYGGSMHNNVVDRLFRYLPAAGVPTLRFNFRGVGASEGTHGGGDDERADVVAAVDLVTERFGRVPILAAGYSFGADVILSVTDERIGAWLAVSPPLRIVEPAAMGAGPDARPVVIITGSADDFRPADEASAVVKDWASTEVLGAPGVDHFWMTGLDELQPAVGRIVAQITATST